MDSDFLEEADRPLLVFCPSRMARLGCFPPVMATRLVGQNPLHTTDQADRQWVVKYVQQLGITGDRGPAIADPLSVPQTIRLSAKSY